MDSDIFKGFPDSGILVADGSIGVMLSRLTRGNRQSDNATGVYTDSPCDMLNLSHPETVAEVHRMYIDAGADIISTNTFNSNRISLSRHSYAHIATRLNLAGARIARNEADEFMSRHPERKIYVAGSIGPSPISLSWGKAEKQSYDKDIEHLSDIFAEQAEALINGGVDILLAETFFDLLNAKAALSGIRKAKENAGSGIPFIISAAISAATGNLYSGHSIYEFMTTVSAYRPLAAGINCSASPDRLMDSLRHMASISSVPLIFYPNAGIPDSDGTYPMTPQLFADEMMPAAEERLAAIIGGCCGTTPGHIKALSQRIKKTSPFQ